MTSRHQEGSQSNKGTGPAAQDLSHQSGSPRTQAARRGQTEFKYTIQEGPGLEACGLCRRDGRPRQSWYMDPRDCLFYNFISLPTLCSSILPATIRVGRGGWVGSGVRQSPRWQINQLGLSLMSEIHHSPAAEPRTGASHEGPGRHEKSACTACCVPAQPAVDCHQDT